MDPEDGIQCSATNIGGDGLQDRARVACVSDRYEDCTGGRAASSLDSIFRVHALGELTLELQLQSRHATQ